MFVARDFSRSETEDWKLNVQNRLDARSTSTPIYFDGLVVGWKIIAMYEGGSHGQID